MSAEDDYADRDLPPPRRLSRRQLALAVVLLILSLGPLSLLILLLTVAVRGP